MPKVAALSLSATLGCIEFFCFCAPPGHTSDVHMQHTKPLCMQVSHKHVCMCVGVCAGGMERTGPHCCHSQAGGWGCLQGDASSGMEWNGTRAASRTLHNHCFSYSGLKILIGGKFFQRNHSGVFFSSGGGKMKWQNLGKRSQLQEFLANLERMCFSTLIFEPLRSMP